MFLAMPGRQMRSPVYIRGTTLVELMVAMVVGVVVIGAIIGLMITTLHASTRNIQGSQVAQEIRAAMEIVSRDLRRAGATPDVSSCYAQNSCNDASANVTYIDSNGVSCVIFWLDRDFDGTGIDETSIDSNEWAGFRYGGVLGVIEMKVSGLTTNDDCSDDTGTWVALTDADVINVTAFDLDTSSSHTSLVSQDTAANEQSLLEVRIVEISITGELAVGGNTKTVNETIRLRNDRFIVQPIPTPT